MSNGKDLNMSVLLDYYSAMLTDKQKELIYALYFEKQTYQEYADIHGISSAAVNNRRKKALARLSASLTADSETDKKMNLRKK